MASGEVHQALTSIGVVALCPICGHDEWIGIGDETDLEVKILAVDGTGELLERADRPGPPWLGVRCEVLLCEQCGWVRLHSAESIARLLRSESGAG